MSNRNDTDRAYLARVPSRHLADLTSSDGPIFTYIEAEGRLHVNPAALEARSAERRARGEMPVPLPFGPIVFTPASSSRHEAAA